MSEYKISTENETWYTSGGDVTNPSSQGLEVIDFPAEEVLRRYYKGSILKYLLHYRKKNGLEDLKKARKHLDWLIELEENNG